MDNSFPDIKRVCVYGVGGVGGYFGGKIANKLNSDKEMGYELYFIARGEHRNIIKRNGITVTTPEQTIVVRPSLATNDIHDIPNPDLFLICVKSYDLEEAIRSITSKVDRSTVVIPLLNGVDIYDRTRAILDNGIVLPACIFLGTHIHKPGVIKHNGGDGIILFGIDPRFLQFTPEKVLNFFKKMSITYRWNDDPYPAIWEKFIFIASFGLIAVFTDKTIGEIMEDEKSIELVRGIMTEIRSIAEKKGIRLSENISYEIL